MNKQKLIERRTGFITIIVYLRFQVGTLDLIFVILNLTIQVILWVGNGNSHSKMVGPTVGSLQIVGQWGIEGLDGPYVCIKFQAHPIILNPSSVAHKFNGYIALVCVCEVK